MKVDSEKRTQLIELAADIRDAYERGMDAPELIAEFAAVLPHSDIANLCHSDMDAETVVDICLGSKDAEKVLSRDQLLDLVRKLCNPVPGEFASESETINAVRLFEYNCKHTDGSDLIFFPEDHFDGRNDPTPEEIVEKAIRGS
ncbi:bacteriocin immunity protein [Aeoliella sp.]|uniref:bacteriocin immunity protein n=1 Tax=Aeoliella sp. TaxID=2795800 RepID=UPI003CCC0B7F